MRRVAALLAATAIATTVGVATAPAASACTGAPCEAFCLAWTTAVNDRCPIR